MAANNWALHHRNKLHLKTYNKIENSFNYNNMKQEMQSLGAWEASYKNLAKLKLLYIYIYS